MMAETTQPQERILSFLNRVQTMDDILHPLVPKGHQENGFPLDEEIARKILYIRNSLPLQRFSAFQQVEAIPGLGKQKLKELSLCIAQPATDAFQARLYDGILSDNFELTAYSTYFDDKDDFYDVLQSDCRFSEWVGNEVEAIALERNGHPKLAGLAKKLLEKCTLEVWENAHFGAIAFAFWFYRFDADNWFTLEQVRKETERYLTYYADNRHRLEIRFFKTFENEGLVADAVTVTDLPVVVNYGEQEVTIWTGQLND